MDFFFTFWYWKWISPLQPHYCRNEVGARLCFLHVSVILFTGESASVKAGIQHPPESRHHSMTRYPPRAGIPQGAGPARSRYSPGAGTHPGANILWEQAPPGADPPAQCMEGDTVNKRAVCILLECNLVFSNLSIVISLSDRTHQRKMYRAILTATMQNY